MDPNRRPENVLCIWAKHGLFEKLGAKIKESSDLAQDKESMIEKGVETPAGEVEVGLKKDWLTAERRSFGPNGWDRLVGEVECVAIDGDHFSIMNVPAVCSSDVLFTGYRLVLTMLITFIFADQTDGEACGKST